MCRNARVIASERGSTFYLCEAARSDPRLRKYPPLPVVSCPGFRTLDAVVPRGDGASRR